MRLILFMLCAAVQLIGCSANRESDPEDREREKQTPTAAPSSAPKPSSPGGSLALLQSLLNSRLEAPGYYGEPIKSAGFEADKPYVATMELDGAIVEIPAFSPLKGAKGTKLRGIVRRIAELAMQ